MKEDITFTPSESLLELADRFSKEFKTTKEEIFKSNDGNYYLHYSDLKERHTGQLVKSYARVGMKSGKIELNRRLLIDNDKINPWNKCKAVRRTSPWQSRRTDPISRTRLLG